eukprot:g7344.t1
MGAPMKLTLSRGSSPAPGSARTLEPDPADGTITATPAAIDLGPRYSAPGVWKPDSAFRYPAGDKSSPFSWRELRTPAAEVVAEAQRLLSPKNYPAQAGSPARTQLPLAPGSPRFVTEERARRRVQLKALEEEQLQDAKAVESLFNMHGAPTPITANKSFLLCATPKQLLSLTGEGRHHRASASLLASGNLGDILKEKSSIPRSVELSETVRNGLRVVKISPRGRGGGPRSHINPSASSGDHQIQVKNGVGTMGGRRGKKMAKPCRECVLHGTNPTNPTKFRSPYDVDRYRKTAETMDARRDRLYGDFLAGGGTAGGPYHNSSMEEGDSDVHRRSRMRFATGKEVVGRGQPPGKRESCAVPENHVAVSKVGLKRRSMSARDADYWFRDRESRDMMGIEDAHLKKTANRAVQRKKERIKKALGVAEDMSPGQSLRGTAVGAGAGAPGAPTHEGGGKKGETTTSQVGLIAGKRGVCPSI